MPSVTLVEAAKVQRNLLVQGVVESMITVNQVYQVMPFDGIVGNAIEYNREKSIGGTAFVGIGGSENTIPAGAKTAATFEPIMASLKPMIGDAYVDHFIQTTMTNPNSQKAVQVASKAKGIARQYQDHMINGDSGADPKVFDGLGKLVPATQKLASAGEDFSFEILDELISNVKSKDGQVDFFMMNDLLLRRYFALLRQLGGAGINETVQLPGGATVPAYRGVPMFRNDWINVADNAGVKSSDIYAGAWDDGSRRVGVAGLMSENQMGISVNEVGEAQDSNNIITRVRFYAGFALYSELGIAAAPGVVG